MTLEELRKVKFHFVSSLALVSEHRLSFVSEDGRLGFCDITPTRQNGDFGKSIRHYMIDGKVYKTKEAFEEAIKDFNPNV